MTEDNKSSTARPERIAYLIECLRLAHEECMMRVRSRDNWLKLQLTAQVILLAMSQGVELSGIKTSGAYPDIIAFSPIISAVFSTLYLIELNIVIDISRYKASLSALENQISGGPTIANWDASGEFQVMYKTSTLPLRTFSLLLAFFLVPLTLMLYRSVYIQNWSGMRVTEFAVNALILLYALGTVWLTHRRRAGKVRPLL